MDIMYMVVRIINLFSRLTGYKFICIRGFNVYIFIHMNVHNF